MGVTEVGFLVRCGLVFRSQSLFGVARLFNELGDSPVVTQVDSVGELTSKNTVSLYDARGTRFQPTCGGDSWFNGFIEKRIGVTHDLGRSIMWRAGLHPGYWYFAVSHAILIMNLMLRARTLSGVSRDITVWETHYGQRPNVGELLLGPFVCLAYLILTKEARQRKGMSTYWGVRAIPGIYLGSAWIITGRQQGMHFFGGERELIDKEVQAYRYKIQIRDRGHFWRSSQNSLHTIHIQQLRHSHKDSNWVYVSEDDRNVSGIKR